MNIKVELIKMLSDLNDKIEKAAICVSEDIANGYICPDSAEVEKINNMLETAILGLQDPLDSLNNLLSQDDSSDR